MFRLRLATPGDLPALRELIPASVRALSLGHYTPQQVESAIRYVFGPDTQLIADGTYFVVEAGKYGVAGCGGWSRRRTLYGGDQMKGATDDLLDPAAEPARVRAFFVAPGWERRGVASRIMRACFAAAREAGFMGLQLVSTLPGVPLYRRWGFTTDRFFDAVLPDGTPIAFVEMSCKLDAQPPA